MFLYSFGTCNMCFLFKLCFRCLVKTQGVCQGFITLVKHLIHATCGSLSLVVFPFFPNLNKNICCKCFHVNYSLGTNTKLWAKEKCMFFVF